MIHSIKLAPLALYTAEAEEVHRLLDVAGVPRITDGQALSMAQRVAEGMTMLRLANARGVAPSDGGDASGWWALVMGAAASIEDAANCLGDADAKKQAEGAAKHYREAAKKLAATAGVPPPSFYCNKCGYRGPEQVSHQRPNGTGECGYIGRPVDGVSVPPASASDRTPT